MTLPEDLLAAAETAVAAGRARSISAYIAAVAGAGEARMNLSEVLAEWNADATTGDDEKVAADRWAQEFLARNDARRSHRASGQAA